MTKVLFFLLVSWCVFVNIGWAIQNDTDNPDPDDMYTWVSNTGNDTLGTGTFINPYRTLMKAECLEFSGTKTTIYVKAGTYKELHSFSNAYTWIAVGIVTLQSASTTQVVELVANSNATVLNGFIIDRETTTAGNHIELLNGANNKSILNCSFIGFYATTDRAIHLNGNTGIVVDNCTFTTTVTTPQVFRSDSSNPCSITITRCTTSGTYSAIYAGINATGKDTVTISYCNFNHSTGYGIYVAKDIDLILDNNIITYLADTTTRHFLAVIDDTNSYEGTLTLTNNTFNLGAYTYITSTAAMFNIIGNNNAFTFIFNNNSVIGTSASIVKPVIRYSNQLGYQCNNNIFMLIQATSIYSIMTVSQTTRDNTGVMECKNNLIRVNNELGNYVLQFGGDTTSGANNNRIKGLDISGNIIYGHRYYTPTSTTIVHTIFVGHQVDYVIKYNTVIGSGYGIVVKHNNVSSMASGGVFYNVVIDCIDAVHIKGINALKCYGNTLINTLPQRLSLIIVTCNPDATGSITGIDIKNNVLYAVNSASQVLIKKQILPTGQTVSIDCDFNVLYTDNSNTIASADGEFISLANWRALGYDVNSLNAIPELVNLSSMSQFNPRPILNSNVLNVGTNLGTVYNYGIDPSSEPPLIVTIQQDSSWDCGAYLGQNIIIPPPIPANLRINRSGSSIVLEWDPSTSAIEYNIYRFTDPYIADWGTPFATTSLTNWEDTTALGYTEYFYRITAISNP